MNIKSGIAAILIIALLSACSKSGNTPSDAITGKWVFRQQTAQSFAYPSILAGNYTILSSSDYALSNDSVTLSLNSNGNYTFTNLRVSADEGTYTLAQDSFLIIHPDTAGLIKFCYPGNSNLIFGTVTPGQPLPTAPAQYAGFQFVSDTILYKKPAADSLVFATYSINRLNTLSSLSQDTLSFNAVHTFFVKK